MFQLGTVSSQREAQMLIEGGDFVFASPNGFKYHVLRQSTTINVYIGGEVELLLLAGGGGGGHGYVSGGGGAGGVLKVPSYTIQPGSYSAVVGDGGAGAPYQGARPPYGSGQAMPASNGQDTTFLGFTAYGGGGGGTMGNYAPGDGGAGGGSASASYTGGSATQTDTLQNSTDVESFGNDGGDTAVISNRTYGGGGGGASQAGSTRYAGAGMDYQSYALFKFAGGGRAGYTDWGVGNDVWGGGSGAWSNEIGRYATRIDAFNAVANTGSGGGGGAGNGGPYYAWYSKGGNGGSGLIIIKYRFISY